MRIDVAVPSESIGVRKPSTKGAVILLVDDDTAVREVTASILRDLGHVVMEVGSGGGALDLLDRNAQIDLVILDFAMPGMNGMEVARQVRAKVPSRPVVFVTGYADLSALADIDETEIVRKPFIGNELRDKVQLALANRAGNLSGKIVTLRR
jgi:CheY-like chemotaxis protein